MADLEDFAFFEVFSLSNFLQTKVLKYYLPKTKVSNCYIDISILDLSSTSLSLQKCGKYRNQEKSSLIKMHRDKI